MRGRRNELTANLKEVRRILSGGPVRCSLYKEGDCIGISVPGRRHGAAIVRVPIAIAMDSIDACHDADQDHLWCAIRNVHAAEVDRIISKLGWQWTGFPQKPAESRPKGTDEVAPCTMASEDSQLHGGDGASGEVDAAEQQAQRPAATDGEPARKDAISEPLGAQCQSGEETGGTATGGGATAEASRLQNGGDDRQLPAGYGKPTDRAGIPDAGEPTAPLDNPACDAQVGTRNGDALNGEKAIPASTNRAEWGGAKVLARLGGPVTSPSNTFGGTFDDAMRAAVLKAAVKKEAAAVARALRRLIDAADIGGINESPRIDGPRLVRELVSKRMSLQRAVRRELDLPLVLLLCDVSGSCRTVCTETMAACLAIVKELPNAYCLRHSNGWLCQKVPDSKKPTITEWIRQSNRRIGLVVAFGDWEAGDEYRDICESGTKLVWFDCYASSHGPRPASRRLRKEAEGWKNQPLAWWQGVSDAASAAIALRCVAREIKK